MNRSVESAPDHRRRVGLLLALLAGEDGQQRLARESSRERLAFELTRAWFDLVYLPGASYLEGLKGDFSADAAEAFRDCFDPVEMAAMERFHRFFELRVDMLPEGCLTGRCIPIDERWRSVMRDAAYLLEDLGWDADDLRRRIREGAETGLTGLIRIED